MGFSFPGFLKELRPKSIWGGSKAQNEMNLGSPEAPQPRSVRCGPWPLPGSPVTSRGPWQPGPPEQDFRVEESRSPVRKKRGLAHFVVKNFGGLRQKF